MANSIAGYPHLKRDCRYVPEPSPSIGISETENETQVVRQPGTAGAGTYLNARNAGMWFADIGPARAL